MHTDLSLYIPIAVMFFLAVATGFGMIAASHLMSPRFRSQAKDVPYESGIKPFKDARDRFNVKFCVVAILFLIFDVEAAFIFPWALMYKHVLGSVSPVFLIVEMFVFVAVLLFGLYYAYKRGGLEWE